MEWQAAVCVARTFLKKAISTNPSEAAAAGATAGLASLAAAPDWSPGKLARDKLEETLQLDIRAATEIQSGDTSAAVDTSFAALAALESHSSALQALTTTLGFPKYCGETG